MGQTVTGGSFDIDRLKKIRLAGKIPALEGLARHLGLFTDERVSLQLQQAFSIRFTSAKTNCQVIYSHAATAH